MDRPSYRPDERQEYLALAAFTEVSGSLTPTQIFDGMDRVSQKLFCREAPAWVPVNRGRVLENLKKRGLLTQNFVRVWNITDKGRATKDKLAVTYDHASPA